MKRLATLAMLSLVATACGKKDDAAPATASSATEPLKPTVPAVDAKPFVVEADGKATIDMPAPNEHIKASAQGASGVIFVDPANLAATRGEVRIDLTTLKTATFGDAKKDATQTEHALNWLEVGTLVTPEEREKYRSIVFSIQSVEGLSATDLAKVAPTKDGADDVRTVTAKVKGEVLLHGKKSPRDADVSVAFRSPTGAPADKPARVDVKTVTPFKITLADHDVKPRDNVGKIAQSAFHLLGTKVAEHADVSIELIAKPK